MKKVLIIILSISILVIQACDLQDALETDKLSSDIKQTISLAMPIAKSSITLKEIMPKGEHVDDILRYDEDGFARIFLRRNFAEIKIRDFLNKHLTYVPPGVNIVDLPILKPAVFPINPAIINLNFDELESFRGFQFVNTRVTLNVKNYWALPVRMRFNEAYYYFESTTAPGYFKGSAIENWHDIKVPETLGDFAVTKIELNETNSNFAEIMSDIPHKMEFGLICETQPDVIGKTYKIDLTAQDSVSLEVEVPMKVKITDVVIKDTVAFDIYENDDNNSDDDVRDADIDYAKLNLIFDNAFPLSAKIKVLMADENYIVIGQLTDDDLVIKAGNSENGKNSSVRSIVAIEVEGEKADKLEKTKNLLLEIKISTNDKVVKLYKQYSLDLKVGVKTKLTFGDD